MDIEKMREQFEAWFMAKFGFDVSKNRAVDDLGVSGYVFGDDFNDERTLLASAAWISWQASREAVVVELPMKSCKAAADRPNYHKGRNDAIECTEQLLDEQGLKYKVAL